MYTTCAKCGYFKGLGSGITIPWGFPITHRITQLDAVCHVFRSHLRQFIFEKKTELGLCVMLCLFECLSLSRMVESPL